MTATALEIDGGIAATYAKLGRPDEARNAARRACERFRTSAAPVAFDAQRWRDYWKRVVPLRNETLFEELLAAFELAGLPSALECMALAAPQPIRRSSSV